jgi:hypothetical protein
MHRAQQGLRPRAGDAQLGCRERKDGTDRNRKSSPEVADGGRTEADSPEEPSSDDSRTQQILEKLKKARAMARRAADLAEREGSEKDDG